MKVEEIEPSLWQGSLAASWESLLEESSQPTIFLSLPWISSWWRHFGRQAAPRLLAVWGDDGTLWGLAPLYERILLPAPMPARSVLGFLGDEGVGSEYLGFLLHRDHQAPSLQAIARHLEDRWSLLDLKGLREESTSTAEIRKTFAQRCPARVHTERHPCSMIPLAGDYEAYLASLPQKFRSTLRYRTNKLIKNFKVRMIRTSTEAELAPHLERLFSMHQARWRSEGHPGSFYSPDKRLFYEEVSRDFLQRGWLRFYQLEVDGTIRASQFGFTYGGILHSLQEAFDHDFHPPGVGGVGVVLRGMAIQDCIGEGTHGYDFLGGIEEFKTRWGTRTHYVNRIRIGAAGLSGALAYAATAGVRRLKDWGRERAPDWLLEGRTRLQAWRRARKVPPTAAGAADQGQA